MDAYEIVNALNQILNLADTLDDTGVVGVKALSNGQYTTREVCRLELSQFLLYIANWERYLYGRRSCSVQHCPWGRIHSLSAKATRINR